MTRPPDFVPPESFNMADYFLGARIREGKGERVALRTAERDWTYAEVQAHAARFGHLLRAAGVEPEQRVLIALPDGPDYVGALFGALAIGAAVVMVNPFLREDALAYFFDYTRAKVALVDREMAPAFTAAADGRRFPRELIVVGDDAFAARLAEQPDTLDSFPTHRDDAALWLFSGGTSGRPKAVLQTHASYANSTERYGKGVLGLRESDITISVPKLFFGYATGSNLFFPFAVGASCALFPERCTPETLFDAIARFRPTVLVNVPTMVQQMVASPAAAAADLSSLRLATSAGEPLPVELYHRWKETFGVELLDGLGTAEMWHIFVSNRPGAVRPGTLGQAVPGFDVRVRDDAGHDLGDDEIGKLWVRGGSLGLGYWQQAERTRQAFRGEWYVSEDMVSRDADGWFRHHGRADDLLKVAGKWLSPLEVENCLLQHEAVREACVVGVVEEDGLTRPYAYVVAADAVEFAGLGAALQAFVHERLEGYKVPRRVVFLEAMPRTHLGKVDRGKLRGSVPEADA